MNFTCPFCHRVTTITAPNADGSFVSIDIAAEHLLHDDRVGLEYLAIACPNKECKQLYLVVKLSESIMSGGRRMPGSTIHSWPLLPESSAKPQPDYIPPQIVEDYNEACRIRTLSPKASATLSRRCIQGMIRDFHGVHEGRLVDEISKLKGKIPDTQWSAIDAVRSIGNIGAHMEKDVNLIIDIAPEEADQLITLVEYLFEHWYVQKHEDEANLAAIKKMAEAKKIQKDEDKASAE